MSDQLGDFLTAYDEYLDGKRSYDSLINSTSAPWTTQACLRSGEVAIPWPWPFRWKWFADFDAIVALLPAAPPRELLDDRIPRATAVWR